MVFFIVGLDSGKVIKLVLEQATANDIRREFDI